MHERNFKHKCFYAWLNALRDNPDLLIEWRFRDAKTFKDNNWDDLDTSAELIDKITKEHFANYIISKLKIKIIPIHLTCNFAFFTRIEWR